MPWSTSDRRSRLPANWGAITKAVKDRDGWRCTFRFPNGGRCPERELLEVDHVIPNDDDSLTNLATLCKRHHGMKSAKEGVAARAARKKANQKFRRVEKHPGRLGLKDT